MDGHIDLTRRFRLLGIDADTEIHINLFKPILLRHVDTLIEAFYQHLLKTNDGNRLLGQSDMGALHARQRIHWLRLFSCDLDPDYVRAALHIGDVHYQSGVAPYIYIAGYSFVRSKLTRLACAHFQEDARLADILVAITKLTSLDMDLALSAYTRDAWAHAKMQRPAKHKTVVQI